ncbi:hypothetical protein PHYSODRAFT_554513 [Phytophthora sojae]|uniref:Apple domain-containing protein n=1 Tax=Phytophthora sojae (strain P6497) TaxID=1094619 RepID=G4YRE7_PHYSP|nr:hypothetical protein PHYSODRAFT_554513 [Phytophthora sojae]EGZ22881.1 hypothetical protein PHYSODRAFT_554513 [Phytophthora sojae]|eukprot:XP_009518169.1 hypothetical protein PHYSODRAFT_554513 [Phytophthora sojae]
MARFLVIALLSALCSLQADAFRLRTLAENPFLPVHRHLASCPTTSGVDYLGNDIKSVSNVPVSDCCTLCSQTTGCGAFTWTNYNGGTCWLKSAKGNTASNPAATSAVLVPDEPGCTLNDGVDYQDNDIANVGASNAGACCSICSTWPGCNAFTWSNYNGGTCWLKSKKGTTVNKAGVKSAEVKNTVGQCTLQQNVDFVDNDIGNTPGKTPGDCCGICNNWSGCRSFSWTNLNGGTCWLKSAKGQTVSKSGVVSSQLLDNPPPSCSLEANVDYVDNDLANVGGAKVADCCDKCRAYTGCHAFSWSNYNGGTCWLKSKKGSTTSKSGVTSAVVF